MDIDGTGFILCRVIPNGISNGITFGIVFGNYIDFPGGNIHILTISGINTGWISYVVQGIELQDIIPGIDSHIVSCVGIYVSQYVCSLVSQLFQTKADNRTFAKGIGAAISGGSFVISRCIGGSAGNFVRVGCFMGCRIFICRCICTIGGVGAHAHGFRFVQGCCIAGHFIRPQYGYRVELVIVFIGGEVFCCPFIIRRTGPIHVHFQIIAVFKPQPFRIIIGIELAEPTTGFTGLDFRPSFRILGEEIGYGGLVYMAIKTFTGPIEHIPKNVSGTIGHDSHIMKIGAADAIGIFVFIHIFYIIRNYHFRVAAIQVFFIACVK